jgi:diacylglycerol kinase (ATP)
VRDIFLYGGWSIDVRLVLIVNPIFDLSGATLSIIETVFPGHARELAVHLDLDEYEGLLALGGDGTFHEVVNRMLDLYDGKKILVGMIPRGSGHSFLHDLGLVDLIKATKAIISK